MWKERQSNTTLGHFGKLWCGSGVKFEEPREIAVKSYEKEKKVINRC